MGFDPSVSYVAALFFSPSVRVVASKERNRRRLANLRSQWTEHLRFIKRIESLQKPLALWSPVEQPKTEHNPWHFFKNCLHPCKRFSSP